MNPLREICIVVAAPRTPAVVKMIPDTLEAMHKEVGGPLEIFYFDGLTVPFAIHCYIHEEGKFAQPPLAPNVAVSTGRHMPESLSVIETFITARIADALDGPLSNPPPGDVIVGNIVASKAHAVSGEEIGLTEREARFACLYLDNLRGLDRTAVET